MASLTKSSKQLSLQELALEQFEDEFSVPFIFLDPGNFASSIAISAFLAFYLLLGYYELSSNMNYQLVYFNRSLVITFSKGAPTRVYFYIIISDIWLYKTPTLQLNSKLLNMILTISDSSLSDKNNQLTFIAILSQNLQEIDLNKETP